jgi:predicted phosphodiesterase
MRVAALYDIHGNLPALDAVLGEVAGAGVDAYVIGGDVAPGPMTVEVLDRLAALDGPVFYVMGNGDRELVERFDAGPAADEADEPIAQINAWCAARLRPEHRDLLAGFQPQVTLDLDGLGPTLFCHGSPRGDTEIITSLTGEDRLGAMLAGVAEATVLCGHTHRQFDYVRAGKRVINAGAVGMPYEGRRGAFWALLGGPGVELRETGYDVERALERFRATGCPGIEEALRASLVEPADPDWVADLFERSSAVKPRPHLADEET